MNKEVIMNKTKNAIAGILTFLITFLCFSCSAQKSYTIVVPGDDAISQQGENQTVDYDAEPFGPEAVYAEGGLDTRPVNLATNMEYTFENLVATDVYGREVIPRGKAVTDGNGNVLKRDVGIFYYLLNGNHPNLETNVYDISKILKEHPELVFDMSAASSAISPLNQQHWWGESLFGYYRSADPWVINKHMQMLMDMELDFIGFDITNLIAYVNVSDVIVKTLAYYKEQGFRVPKLMWVCNHASHEKVEELYNSYFNEETAGPRGYYYPDLWYSPNGKPLVSVNKGDFLNITDAQREAYEFIDAVPTQWPNEPHEDEAFSWMEFIYPQLNHNGQMNVSVMQHAKTGSASDEGRNWGRGYSHPEGVTEYGQGRGTSSQRNRVNAGTNSLEAGRAGLNLSRQWDTVYSTLDTENPVNRVFITQFNEWVAPKLNVNGAVKYIDEYSEEYSRDIEPMKGGYGDNFLLLTRAKVNRYKYGTATRYTLPQNTVTGINDDKWNGVRSFMNYVSPEWAINRDFLRYGSSTERYKNETTRNRIKTVQVTHDGNNLYIKVTTAEKLTKRTAGDYNYMNVWLGTGSKNSFCGFDYVINRKPGSGAKTSVERSNGGFIWAEAGDATVEYADDAMLVTVPLSLIGADADKPVIRIKVSDNVTEPNDIMNFYVNGNSAPLGRYAYAYGI